VGVCGSLLTVSTHCFWYQLLN